MSTATPPTLEVKARCRHFGACGGCAAQNIAYEGQVETKRLNFQEILSPFYTQEVGIEPSVNPWFYRGKMEFSFSQYKEELRLGLKRKGDWNWVINLEECPIFDESTGPMLGAVRNWIKEEKLEPYNARKHSGFLRYLVTRKGANERGEKHQVLTLVTSPSSTLPKESLIKTLTSVLGADHFSLIHATQASISDAVNPEKLEILHGKPYFYETLSGITFRCSAESFFQPNPRTFERLLNDLVGQARGLEKPSEILDLYCGVGVITLALKKEFEVPASGIEFSASSISDARFNAEGSHIPFEVAKVEDVLKPYLEKPEMQEGWVVLDPPRAGIHPKVRKALIENPPKTIFYVSCNPEKACKEDLPLLNEIYKIAFTRAYDFFPHTRHYEAFFVLTRKEK